MRVGVFGGAFNPPHLGHLVCAQEALVRLALDTVVFVPVGTAPHRELAHDPGGEERLRMCELATRGDDRLAVSRVEIDRPGPSYTADTLDELGKRSPGDELVLLLGGDQATSLPEWHEPRRVLALADGIGVARRAGFDRARVGTALSAIDGAAGRVEFFDMPSIEVSSSLVRERVRAGEPIRYLVPDAVADHIATTGLYAAGSPVEAGP